MIRQLLLFSHRSQETRLGATIGSLDFDGSAWPFFPFEAGNAHIGPLASGLGIRTDDRVAQVITELPILDESPLDDERTE
jgi:hypothetical protein